MKEMSFECVSASIKSPFHIVDEENQDVTFYLWSRNINDTFPQFRLFVWVTSFYFVSNDFWRCPFHLFDSEMSRSSLSTQSALDLGGV